jgi:hypothetical protein
MYGRRATGAALIPATVPVRDGAPGGSAGPVTGTSRARPLRRSRMEASYVIAAIAIVVVAIIAWREWGPRR